MNNQLDHPSEIAHHEIARRASQIWASMGRPAGKDEIFWFQAEAELRAAKTPPVIEPAPAPAPPAKPAMIAAPAEPAKPVKSAAAKIAPAKSLPTKTLPAKSSKNRSQK